MVPRYRQSSSLVEREGKSRSRYRYRVGRSDRHPYNPEQTEVGGLSGCNGWYCAESEPSELELPNLVHCDKERDSPAP